MSSCQLERLVRGLFDEKRLHERVGSAWKLFFFICCNLDEENELTTSYAVIAQRLGVGVSTVKTWRKYLVKSMVIRSYMGGNVVHFRVMEPFKTFLRENGASPESRVPSAGVSVLEQ